MSFTKKMEMVGKERPGINFHGLLSGKVIQPGNKIFPILYHLKRFSAFRFPAPLHGAKLPERSNLANLGMAFLYLIEFDSSSTFCTNVPFFDRLELNHAVAVSKSNKYQDPFIDDYGLNSSVFFKMEI